MPTSSVRIRTVLPRPQHPTEAKNLASSSAVIQPRHSNQLVSAGSESAHRRTPSCTKSPSHRCRKPCTGHQALRHCVAIT